MLMPEISIIVPVYKVEQYLPRCIDSILAQTFTDFELLLIDDGSPDNSGKICDEYAAKDSRIRVFHKGNGGVSSARNLGLDNAQGKYIGFVDSDDVIPPFYYQTLISYLFDNDVVCCNYLKFSSDSPTFDCDITNSIDYVQLNNRSFFKYGESYWCVWNKIFKREIIKDSRFDTTLKNAEDTLFSFSILLNCESVGYIRNKLYGYFIRGSGAVGSIDLIGKSNLVTVSKTIYDLAVTYNLQPIINYKNSFILNLINLFYSSYGVDKPIFLSSKKQLFQHLPYIISRNYSVFAFKEKMYFFYYYFVKSSVKELLWTVSK